MASLDSYRNTIKERDDYINSLSGQRQAGIDKVKADSGYQGKKEQLDKINKQILDTERSLETQDEDTTRRLSGRLITEAQRGRISTVERQPMLKNYGNLSKTGQYTQSSLDRINQEIEGFGNNFDRDSQTRLSGLNQKASDLFNIYNAESQSELEAIRQANARQQLENERLNASNNAALIKAQIDALKRQFTNTGGTDNSTYGAAAGAALGLKGGKGDDFSISTDEGVVGNAKKAGNSILSAVNYGLNPLEYIRTLNPNTKNLSNKELMNALDLAARKDVDDTGGMSFNPKTNALRLKNLVSTVLGGYNANNYKK